MIATRTGVCAAVILTVKLASNGEWRGVWMVQNRRYIVLRQADTALRSAHTIHCILLSGVKANLHGLRSGIDSPRRSVL